MGNNNSEQKNKKQGLHPAVVGAIITAVAGLIGTILTIFTPDIREWLQGISLPPITFSDETTAPLQGTWEGEVYNSSSRANYDVTLYAVGNCKINASCGSLVLDFGNGRECRATVKITKIQDKVYDFETINESGTCDKEKRRYFQWFSRNVVKYYSTSASGTSTGTLYKQ